MDFQQSKTYSNLLSAYDRDLMASTVYSIYSDTARLAGYIQVSNVFTTVSNNEKEHARIWLRNLNSGMLPDTLQSLQNADVSEANSARQYRQYAQTAREEGYDDIASLFNGVANIELNHELMFRSLADELQSGTMFCKPIQTLWICLQCGNILSSECAPEICPVCGFPQGYYQLYNSKTI